MDELVLEVAYASNVEVEGGQTRHTSLSSQRT